MTTSAIAAEPELYWTPDRVRYWVERWPLLETLAESPSTSRHHFEPEHKKSDVPCNEPMGGSGHDPMHFVDLHADLRSAGERLPIGSLERRVVALRRQTSRLTESGDVEFYSLEVIGMLLRTRKRTVGDAYRRAVVCMAQSLGWREPRREPDSHAA